ncbi:MAG: AtpZ/AtpI family protein [Helicobacteraceae bacterium]|nr:AtpZ/AtpI family protein [Helicobacteraceae bacterium]
MNNDEPKYKRMLSGIAGLSLGISIVVALLLGVGAGMLLQKIFGVFWVFWIGVFWGVCAAILNVYKAYKSQLKEFEELAKDPKYNHK